MSLSPFLRFSAIFALSCGLAFAANPGGDDDDDEPDCDSDPSLPQCDPCSQGSKSQSMGYGLFFGEIPFEEGLDRGRLALRKTVPAPTIFTPQVLYYRSQLGVQLSNRDTSGVDWKVSLVGRDAKLIEFKVPENESKGYPVGRRQTRSQVIELLDADRAPVVAGSDNPSPAYVRLIYPEGDQVELSWSSRFVTRYRAASGREVVLADLPEETALRLIHEDGVLRQIKAAQGLLDLVQVADQIFEIRLYEPALVGTYDPELGVYPVTGAPYHTVRFENPTGDPDRYDRIKITDTWGTRVKIDFFDYDEDTKEWLLQQGASGLQRKEAKIRIPGPGSNERTYVKTLRDENDNLVSTVREVWRDFAWREELVSRTVEPDTLNLTETYSYHTASGQPGHAQIKSKTYPDGFWETFAYDTHKRLTQKVTPWKDTAFASAATGPRVITTHAYASLDGDDTVTEHDHRPRTVTESVVTTGGGSPVVTKRIWHVYKTDSAGVYTEIEERAASAAASFGASGNLRTTRVHYTTKSTETGYDADSAGRLHYEDRPDGTRTTYTYTRDEGDLNAYWIVSEVLATPAMPSGINGLSTRTDRVHDVRGHLVATRSYIRSGGAWHLVSTEARVVNGQGFHVATHRDGRQTHAAAYDADLLVTQTSDHGVTTTYLYDALDKVESETRAGVAASGSHAAQPDITTTYLRELGGIDCGCDGEVTAITTAGSLSLETQTKKDKIGRLTYQKDSAGLETHFAYSLGGRQTTRTNPDSGTVIELNFSDRRLASVTGTGAVAEYYDYGVNGDGTTWTKVSQVSSTGDRWEKTTVNHLDQIIQVERPAHDGGVIVTSHTYDHKGRLVRERQRHLSGATETTLIADTLTEYDTLGNVSRRGLDVNANGTLDLASADRITDTVHTFVQHESAWWRVTQTKVYPTAASSAAVQISETRRRLSGYTTTLVGETVTLDIDGNVTGRAIEIDFSGKLVTTTATYPDSVLPTVAITRNGLLVSETGKTVASPTLYGYDALGRRTSAKDPRHAQAAAFAYDATTGQLTSWTDAAGNATTYTYYANGEAGAGQVKVATDALGQTRRSAYDLLGRETHQWGSADYPQAYTYTAHGEIATLTTWRDAGATNFDAATWPAPGGGDVTTWSYQASTGLLSRKQYADGKGTDYAYDQLNRLATRTWAREVSDDPLITAYDYAAATGELTAVDYSDNTPDVAFTHDRLGRQAAVTDATGTRSFAYDSAKLRLESETLPAYFGDRILSRIYQGSGTGLVSGRAAGFQLGTSGDLDEDHAVSYGYDSSGRLNAVASPAGAFAYGYVSDSDLLASVASPAHDTTYGYEPNRNLRTEVRNRVAGGGADRSRYVYAYDEVGQRISRVQSGSAFGTTSYDRFGYNTRSEVIETKRYTGTDPEDHLTDPEATALGRLYTFDHLGNRLTSQDGLAATRVYTSNALNQYTGITNPNHTPAYDEDGNQLVVEDGWRYQWDAENRLVRARDHDVTPVIGSKGLTFVYDYQSRRVRKTVEEYDGTAWQVIDDRKFIYDGWNLIAEYRWNLSTSTYDLTSTFTWGFDLSQTLQGAGGVGGLLAITTGGDSYYPTYDANGNVSEYLDDVGVVEAHFQYDPFGCTIAASGSDLERFTHRFSTKYRDAGMELYYYGYRFYNPMLGRWPSRDPISERGGLNLYGMVGNNLAQFYDVLGLFCPKNCLPVGHKWKPKGKGYRLVPGGGGVSAAKSLTTGGAILGNLSTIGNLQTAAGVAASGTKVVGSAVGNIGNAIRDEAISAGLNPAGAPGVGSDGMVMSAWLEQWSGVYGTDIVVDIEYEECVERTCLIFCKKTNYEKKEAANFHVCTVNKKISQINAGDVNACYSEAIAKF